MRIMTCNIRFYGADDGPDSWDFRRELCLETIRTAAPDIICFQEMWAEQWHDARAGLPGYECYGLADMPGGKRPVNSIFFRRDGFALVSAAGYWLSESPHVPGSRSWESACVRLANWVHLREKAGGRELRVLNTHLDHVSQAARENQAALICADAAAWGTEYPQLLAGDLNCDSRNRAIAALREAGWRDTWEAVHGTADPGHTFHAFQGPGFRGETGKMDWVFSRGALRAKGAEITKRSENGRFPSDHYFVSADVEFAPGET